MMSDTVGGALKYIGAGQIRALAIASAVHNPMLPDAARRAHGARSRPARRSGGRLDGLVRPAQNGPAVVDRVNDAARRVLASADFQARLAALGDARWAGWR